MHPNLLQRKNKNETEVETILLRVGLSYDALKYKQILQPRINLLICKIFNLYHLKDKVNAFHWFIL